MNFILAELEIMSVLKRYYSVSFITIKNNMPMCQSLVMMTSQLSKLIRALLMSG